MSDQGWQPIKTAPKDGTIVMVFGPGYEWPEVVKWEEYEDQETKDEIGEDGYWTYAEGLLAISTDTCSSEEWSHWQPLPPPPDADGDAR